MAGTSVVVETVVVKKVLLVGAVLIVKRERVQTIRKQSYWIIILINY